jgi:hypothetical protein
MTIISPTVLSSEREKGNLLISYGRNSKFSGFEGSQSVIASPSVKRSLRNPETDSLLYKLRFIVTVK